MTGKLLQFSVPAEEFGEKIRVAAIVDPVLETEVQFSVSGRVLVLDTADARALAKFILDETVGISSPKDAL